MENDKMKSKIMNKQIEWFAKRWFAERRNISPDDVEVDILLRQNDDIHFIVTIGNSVWNVMWSEAFMQAIYESRTSILKLYGYDKL